MRTLTIAGSSLYMRIFLWVWPVDPVTLNICKIFWGTVLFPVAFCSFGWKMWGIPRVSYLYVGLAIVFGVLGAYVSAALFVIIAVGAAVIVRFKRSEEKDLLAESTGRAGATAEWIGERIFDHIFDFVDNARDSRVGERLAGFFSVAAAYYRSVKERSCLKVDVV